MKELNKLNDESLDNEKLVKSIKQRYLETSCKTQSLLHKVQKRKA